MKYNDSRKEEMWLWFHDNFAPPEECNPSMSAEHGYQYVCGGPYYAAEVLTTAFGGKMHHLLIKEVAEDLELESHEWIVKEGHAV